MVISIEDSLMLKKQKSIHWNYPNHEPYLPRYATDQRIQEYMKLLVLGSGIK